MKKPVWLVLLLLVVLPSVSKADFTMEVFASSAPNFTAGGAWGDYTVNAMNSLENGLGNIGDRDVDPAAYVVFDTGENISINNAVVSNFNSWLGVANPAFPFDGEGGNRLHFGLHIVGDGTMQFSMADITYEISSDDGNSLGFSGGLGTGNYSSLRVGIDYGGDNMKGGGDDTIINSGASSQLIDEFIYVGVGNAFDASPMTGPSDQEKLDQIIAAQFNNYPINVLATYTLNDSGGNPMMTGSTNVNIVPEPAAALLIGTGTVICLNRRRRRSQ